MDSSTETVEIDVKHSSQRHITADGEAIKISIKCDTNSSGSESLLNRSRDETSPRGEVNGSPRNKSPGNTGTRKNGKSPDLKEGKLCQYFKKSGRCRFEDKCHYVHYPGEVAIEAEQKNKNESNGRPSKVNKSPQTSFYDNTYTTARSASSEERRELVNGDSYLNINSSNTTPCRFFVTKRGCKFGDRCPFTHYRSVGDAGLEGIEEEIKRELGIMTEKTNTSNNKGRDHNKLDEEGAKSKAKRAKKCMFFFKDGFCKKSDACEFSHTTKEDVLTEPFTFDNVEDPKESKNNLDSNDTKTQKKCKFFLSRSGCRSNDDCPYLHEYPENDKPLKRRGGGRTEVGNKQDTKNKENKEAPPSPNDVSEINPESRKDRNRLSLKKIELEPFSKNEPIRKSNQYCSYFLTPKGCFRGDKCVYLHPLSDKETEENVNDDDKYLKLQVTEYQQLEKRFSADDRYTLIQSEPSTIYSVIFEPSDPDWGIVVKQFVLCVEFPAEYPKEMFNITLEDNDIYPEGFTRFMNEGVQAWITERKQDRCDTDLAFRPFLKWFDRSVENLVLDAGRKVQQLRNAHEAGITLVPHETILENMSIDDTDPHEDEPCVDEEETPDNDTNEIDHSETTSTAVNEMLQGPESARATNAPAKLSAKVKFGTEMKFSHLEVNENVASIILKNLLLVVQCSRCKGRTEFNLQTKKKTSASCKKCHVNHTATFHSEVVHQYSHVAGYLHLEGCKAFDAVLVDSTVLLNCLNCSKDTIKKGIAYGKKGDYWCEHCHTKMEIQIMSSKFTLLQKNGEKIQEVKPAAIKKPVKHPGIKDGSPLPDNGTCKHYKKSYRWLRFPCCGKVYPCDICHEEGEENDHDMKFATRMICGYCSKEQPFAKDKPCVSCKANVTKSRSTHWEGGKGCRNRATMDRNDNKKTAGLGKTISRKQKAESEK